MLRRLRTILTTWLFALGAFATAPALARAEDSQGRPSRGETSEWMQSGWTARVGSSVGYTDVAKERWSTLGAQVGVGYRIGPLAIEAEYEKSRLLYYTGLENKLRGDVRRLGASARFYFLRLGQLHGGHSQMLLFVDAAVGTQRGTIEGLGFARHDYGSGMGWLLDHRVNRPGVGIKRVGWHLGWRVTGTPRASEAMARIVCKGSPCPMLPPRTESNVDVGLALGSSLSLGW